MLNASSLSSNLFSTLQQVANLDSDGIQVGTPPTPDNTFATQFAILYDQYAAQGVVAGAINSGGDPSSLASTLSNLPNSTVSRSQLANALAAYWSDIAVDNGVPAHGGVSVVNVTNNASSKVSDFLSAINSSVRDTESRPFFLEFINNIESVVKSINWTVTERMSNGSNVNFIVNIN